MIRFVASPPPRNRMLHGLAVLSYLLAGTLFSSHAFSQFQPTPRIDEEHWYQVEVIVFAQGGGPQDDEEIWRTDIDLDYPLNWRELLKPAQLATLDKENENLDTTEDPDNVGNTAGTQGPSDALSEPGEAIGERAMLLLPDEELTLSDQARRLSRSREHRILFHGAWRQSMVENRQEPSVLISGGELFDQHHELEGSINLHLRTYLHIETDLWLSRFATNFGQEGRPWPKLPWPPNQPVESGNSIKINDGGTGLWHQFNQNRNDQYEAILAQPYVVESIVLMQQNRRMRSDELHYIDHPKMGVLVKLTPYEPAEDAATEDLGALPDQQ